VVNPLECIFRPIVPPRSDTQTARETAAAAHRRVAVLAGGMLLCLGIFVFRMTALGWTGQQIVWLIAALLMIHLAVLVVPRKYQWRGIDA
jgi:uncharacterized membrane protein SirB2